MASVDVEFKTRRALRSSDLDGGTVTRQSTVSEHVERIEKRLSAHERSQYATNSVLEDAESYTPMLSTPTPSRYPAPLTPPVDDGAVDSLLSTVQQSPPTPDQTPPKRPQPVEHRKPRTTPSSYLHSATGSFITAQEEFSVEDLMGHSASYSPQPLLLSRPAVGLGLDLETPNGTAILGESLAAAWRGEAVAGGPFKAMAVRKMGKYTTEDFQASFDRVTTDADKLSLRSQPRSQDSDFLLTNPKRVSDISAASQVIQVQIVTPPRRKRQRLRHCSKNESLRTATTGEGSNRSSMVSNEQHSNPPDARKRVSDNSDSGISMGSSFIQSKPPPELLGRMSSLRRSSAKERALSRQLSNLTREGGDQRQLAAPERSSTTSIPGEDLRPKSLPRHSSGRTRRTIDYPPIIPARGSSLSAPTSKNNSRAGSMTSSNLQKSLQCSPQQPRQPQRSQQQPQRSPQQPQRNLQQLSPRADRFGSRPDAVSDERRNSEDRNSARRRSALATPFSGVSVLSATPIELNEATAINIFAHNNTSVLVVQQMHGGTDRGGDPRPLAKPFTPLQNPRQAPTPAVMLIPPSPAHDTLPPAVAQLPSRIVSVRSALSGKRHSENIIAPYARSLVDRRRAGHGNTKASSFWRPRAFWKDVEGAGGHETDDADVYVQNTLGLPQRKLILGPGSLSRRIGSLRRRKELLAAGQAIENAETRVGILARLRGQGPPIRPFASLAEAIEKLRNRRYEQRREKQRDRLRRHIGPVIPAENVHHF